MSDLSALVETRLMELLNDTGPECETCGRKGITPAQMTGALRVALQYLAAKAPEASGPEPGSGFKEEEEDDGSESDQC